MSICLGAAGQGRLLPKRRSQAACRIAGVGQADVTAHREQEALIRIKAF